MQPDQPVDLGGIRLPGEHESEATHGPLGVRRAPFPHHAPRQGLRRLDVNGVVERHECLERRVGPRPANRADLATRRVERRHRGIGITPPPGRVEGAAVAVLTVARLPVDPAAKCRGQADIGLRGMHARPPLLSREQPCRGERLIADHLCRQPHAGSARHEPIFRIASDEFGRGSGSLSVGGARDDESDDGLRIPAPIDQLARQPIEQLGMARQLTLAAKLLTCRDDADAKEPFPEPVGNYAGRERIPRIHEPLGQ